MTLATNLGFPRIGARRELKKALERYWNGTDSLAQLITEADNLQQNSWQLQRDAGLHSIPCNDFSCYDHVLDTALMVGAIPPRFAEAGLTVDDQGEPEHDLPLMFAMARGFSSQVAMEMTKWFDTNYHYIVPELTAETQFRPRTASVLRSLRAATAAGHPARPVLLGPVSLLVLSKIVAPSGQPPQAQSEAGIPEVIGGDEANRVKRSLAVSLTEVYRDILAQLAAEGATWVQMDEPALVLDLDTQTRRLYREVYGELAAEAGMPNLFLATYFGALGDNLETALRLPVSALHLDLVRAPEQLETSLAQVPDDKILSLGLVDGRNIWKSDLNAAVEVARYTAGKLGSDRVMVAPSCSLLHTPVDLDLETGLDPEIRDWMAYAKQKLAEVATIAEALNEPGAAVDERLGANRASMQRRWTSNRLHKSAVRDRLEAVNEDMLHRRSPFAVRSEAQRSRFELPVLPTTTIGSFPQTREIRKTRAAYRRGEVSESDYRAFQRECVAETIRFQEQVGLDVLVHGEPERNDMVEYFGEQLDGFLQTEHGWVQSYGSRCVKPPVIYGDVERHAPMSVDWITYAQSLTERPVKGMLTGPVTMLQWSFVRDDQPRSETCRQIALVLRDEVADLEQAGIGVVQVDEPALREGLPLTQTGRREYLQWAVDAFRLATCGVADETQIHTHMCYSEFNEIIESIAALDADVISIEASRSKMELLEVFKEFEYPNQIGPGVYDIHSPLVPSAEEIEELIVKAITVLSPEKTWVNPDCGLKTRRWEEVRPALENMVTATQRVRASLYSRVH